MAACYQRNGEYERAAALFEMRDECASPPEGDTMTQPSEGQKKQEINQQLEELLRDMAHTDFADNHLIYHTLVRLILILKG
jgi:hypothetical protein